jgi:hypothetical protein
MDPIGLLSSILMPFFIVGLAFVAFTVFVRRAAIGINKDARSKGFNLSFWHLLKSAAITIHELLNRNKTEDSTITKSGAEVNSISAVPEQKPAITQDKPANAPDNPAIAPDKLGSVHQSDSEKPPGSANKY